jgi:hypothetical protein
LDAASKRLVSSGDGHHGNRNGSVAEQLAVTPGPEPRAARAAIAPIFTHFLYPHRRNDREVLGDVVGDRERRQGTPRHQQLRRSLRIFYIPTANLIAAFTPDRLRLTLS